MAFIVMQVPDPKPEKKIITPLCEYTMEQVQGNICHEARMFVFQHAAAVAPRGWWWSLTHPRKALRNRRLRQQVIGMARLAAFINDMDDFEELEDANDG